MRVVIQCAGSKRSAVGRLNDPSGREVIFVAHPEQYEAGSSIRCCRPDDEIGPGLGTWRDFLETYNRNGNNPGQLCRAADLYKPRVYRNLVSAFGWENVFILSAGWGLIRSDFLMPNYDITFSSQGKPWSRRSKKDQQSWHDFNHLQDDPPKPGEAIHFFGGRGYLPLYAFLAQRVQGVKIIHHKGEVPPCPNFKYEAYRGPQRQNWHYPAAQVFITASRSADTSDGMSAVW